MRHFMVVGMVCLWIVSPVVADFMDGSFNGGIIGADNWTAGVDDLGKWYGSGYTVEDGAACLSLIGNGKNYGQMKKDQCGLFQALPMPEAGTYSWTLDNKLSNYDKQFDYWMVYAMKAGSRLDLFGNKLGFSNPKGSQRLTLGYSPNGKDDGQWHTFTENFRISGSLAKNYDYLGFVLVGSRHENEMLAFDNVTTTTPAGGIAGVPEPGTAMLMIFAVAGYLGLTRVRSRRV